MQELQQHFLLASNLLKRLTSTPGTSAANQHSFAHLDHGDDCAILCSRAVRDLLASKRKCCDMWLHRVTLR